MTCRYSRVLFCIVLLGIYSVVWPVWKWREIIHGGGTLLEIVSSCWDNVWCNLGMFLIQALKGWENRTARGSRRAGYNWGKIGVSACTFLCVLQRGGKIWKFANIPFAHQCEAVPLLVYMAKICQIIFRCLRQQLPCSIDEPIKVLFPCELLSCWPTLWYDCTILHARAITMKGMVSLNWVVRMSITGRSLGKEGKDWMYWVDFRPGQPWIGWKGWRVKRDVILPDSW